MRAYDAVQLATAWLLNQELLSSGDGPVTFVSADEHLLAVADVERLLIENPNQHSRPR